MGRRSIGEAATKAAACETAAADVKLQPEKILAGRGGVVIVATAEPVVGDAGVIRALVF